MPRWWGWLTRTWSDGVRATGPTAPAVRRGPYAARGNAAVGARGGTDTVVARAGTDGVGRPDAAVPRPVMPPPRMSPAMSVPGVPRTVEPGVRPGSPAPDPRRDDPCPAVGRIVHIRVRRAVTGRRHVRVVVRVRHPDPAVLRRVDPLPFRSRRGRRLRLARWRRRDVRWSGRRSLFRWCGRRRGRLLLRLRDGLTSLRQLLDRDDERTRPCSR
jgi:hypothetical protein